MMRCDACDYVPLGGGHTTVRPPPWTVDDLGLNFFVCRRCGSMTVQKFDAKTSYGQVWMLEPDAMSLLRLDASPHLVLRYILSNDFRSNRVLTEGMFQSWAHHSLGLPTVIRGLISALKGLHDRGLLVTLRNLLAGLEELIVRAYYHTIPPTLEGTGVLVAIFEGAHPTELRPQDLADVRVLAHDCLQLLMDPRLAGHLLRHESVIIDDALDHFGVLANFRSRLKVAHQSVRDDDGFRIAAEVLFIQSVFARRQSWPTNKDAIELWACFCSLHALATTNTYATMARKTIVALLGENLISLGLEPITWREGGTSFQNLKKGWILHLLEASPQIEIYRNLHAGAPVARLERWDDVVVFVTTSQTSG